MGKAWRSADALLSHLDHIGSDLTCPRCEAGSLKPRRATLFRPSAEDHDRIALPIGPDTIEARIAPLAGPDAIRRRETLVIEFTCHECSPVLGERGHLTYAISAREDRTTTDWSFHPLSTMW